MLDPGHGGAVNMAGSSHNNAVSVSGVAEKALTLDFGLALR
ncbi:N-acetylmuramoyl-L-alanine amidase, partial [Sphingomonas solaris]